jgi:hypothetical protein
MKLHTNTKELSWNLLLRVVLPGCKFGESNSYYSLQDFSRVKKIDVHVHALMAHPDLVQQAKDDNFILVTELIWDPDHHSILTN